MAVADALKRAQSHYLAARFAAAETAFREALALDPAQPDAFQGLALVAQERGADDEALAHYERAVALASDLGARHAARPRQADLLVNCTSVGLGGSVGAAEAQATLGLDGIEPPAIVVDLVYGSGPTPVVAWARAGGSRVVEGLEVLVRQGARSLELWTGLDAPIETMRRAAIGLPGERESAGA